IREGFVTALPGGDRHVRRSTRASCDLATQASGVREEVGRVAKDSGDPGFRAVAGSNARVHAVGAELLAGEWDTAGPTALGRVGNGDRAAARESGGQDR